MVVGNFDGETEAIGKIEVTHRFVDAEGSVIPIRWHLVEAGDRAAETILFLHGNPESWRSWAPQIAHFAPRFHVVAPDIKGYGQSDKNPGDWRWENVAEELLAMLECLGIERFNLVGHDRGAVLGDYLGGNHPDRILRYVRMQQILHVLALENSPQREWYCDPLTAPDLFADVPNYLNFRVKPMLKSPVDPDRWQSLAEEFSFPGIADAVPRYFQSSSFEKELHDRVSRLIPNMSFPVLLLQADSDGGQPQQYYVDPKNPGVTLFADARLEWVENSGHFSTLEQPDGLTDHIARFIESVPPAASDQQPSRSRPGQIPYSEAGAKSWARKVRGNRQSERESVGNIEVTHHFTEAPGRVFPVRWHYVEAGDPDDETIVFLHGHPESWHSWAHQINCFADRYHIIAPDLKGYGQSDKRPGEWRHEYVAEELLNLLDSIAVGRFTLVTHDRGTVQGDYIGGNHPDRIIRYVRMQQMLHIMLPQNSPQETIYRDPMNAHELLSQPDKVWQRIFDRFAMKDISKEKRDRLHHEFSFPGIGDAVPRYFQSSSFQKELRDRTTRLCRNMTFPVLLLQADNDVGQPQYYYGDRRRPGVDQFPQAELEWVEGANHFSTITNTVQLTDHIDRFLERTNQAHRS